MKLLSTKDVCEELQKRGAPHSNHKVLYHARRGLVGTRVGSGFVFTPEDVDKLMGIKIGRPKK